MAIPTSVKRWRRSVDGSEPGFVTGSPKTYVAFLNNYESILGGTVGLIRGKSEALA
jgi:hypothetical protein